MEYLPRGKRMLCMALEKEPEAKRRKKSAESTAETDLIEGRLVAEVGKIFGVAWPEDEDDMYATDDDFNKSTFDEIMDLDLEAENLPWSSTPKYGYDNVGNKNYYYNMIDIYK